MRAHTCGLCIEISKLATFFLMLNFIQELEILALLSSSQRNNRILAPHLLEHCKVLMGKSLIFKILCVLLKVRLISLSFFIKLIGCCVHVKSKGNNTQVTYDKRVHVWFSLLSRLYVFLWFCRGYTAPEYAIKGELSEKVDIYSFGVLVLEIISCRKHTDLTLPSEMQYLPEYVGHLHFIYTSTWHHIT